MVTFDIEDEADARRAIRHLTIWVDALTASHAALPVNDTAEPPLTRPETASAKPKKRRSVPEADVEQDNPRRAVIRRGYVFTSRLIAQHGVTHIGELTDDQLRAALRDPA